MRSPLDIASWLSKPKTCVSGLDIAAMMVHKTLPKYYYQLATATRSSRRKMQKKTKSHSYSYVDWKEAEETRRRKLNMYADGNGMDVCQQKQNKGELLVLSWRRCHCQLGFWVGIALSFSPQDVLSWVCGVRIFHLADNRLCNINHDYKSNSTLDL